MEGIATQLVYGFLEAGKTTYIQDSVFHGFFHRRGRTLILCFEEGETAYDIERLADFRTEVALWDGDGDIAGFCREALERHGPDRVFVEMNAMLPGLRDRLPDVLRVGASAMLINGTTLALYARNMRQLMQDMVKASNQITFNRCPDKAALEPYGQLFRLMNRDATFLWEGPGGYHERAFEGFVRYDWNADEIRLGEDDMIPFALDAAAHPEHYQGKVLRLQGQLMDMEGGVKIGRTVMTCCMADLQFMGVLCTGLDRAAYPPGSWLRLEARGEVAVDGLGRRYLTLHTLALEPIKPPREILLKG